MFSLISVTHHTLLIALQFKKNALFLQIIVYGRPVSINSMGMIFQKQISTSYVTNPHHIPNSFLITISSKVFSDHSS